MLLRNPLICCFFLLWFTIASAQEEPIIAAISFEGLKRNQVHYLETFLDDLVGNEVSDSLLQRQVQRLKNIPGIANASYRLEEMEEGQKVIFKIEEQRTRLPIINFGGVKDNVWFQFGAYDVNWRGRGEFVSANYQVTDFRHGGQLFYRKPFVGEGRWGYSISLSRLASKEPLYFEEGTVTYLYDNNSIAGAVIRNFGVNRNLSFGGTFFQEKYKKAKDQELPDPPGPDHFTQPKILSKVIYQENWLNYDYIYLQGRAWQLTYENVYNTFYDNWFHSLQFEARQFFRKGNGNLGFRFRAAIASNNDSPFAPFVVDSHVNLRGSGNRIDRGTAQLILNTEYRHAVFAYGHWAAQLVAFSDFGTWRNPGGELNDLWRRDIMRHFAGGGIRLIFQKVYSAVLRVDYGVDVFDTESQGLVIGLGQYF